MLPTLEAILQRCKQVNHKLTLVLSNPALRQLKRRLSAGRHGEAGLPLAPLVASVSTAIVAASAANAAILELLLMMYLLVGCS